MYVYLIYLCIYVFCSTIAIIVKLLLTESVSLNVVSDFWFAPKTAKHFLTQQARVHDKDFRKASLAPVTEKNFPYYSASFQLRQCLLCQGWVQNLRLSPRRSATII